MMTTCCLIFLPACEQNPSPKSAGHTVVANTGETNSETSDLQFRLSESFSQQNVVYENGEDAQRYAIVESMGGGVGLFDFDADGWLDLVFPAGGNIDSQSLSALPTRMFRQLASEEFVEVSKPTGVDECRHYSHGVAAADYNNDGFTDFVVTGYAGLQLFHNNGDGTFSDVTDVAGLSDSDWSTSAAWGDLNGDGFLDLYVTHYLNWSFANNPQCENPSGKRDVCGPRQFLGVDDIIYFSRGDGTFIAADQSSGLVAEGKGLGVILADWDEDGDLDIYVANDTVSNFYYVNSGNGTFSEQALLAGLAIDDMANPNGSMGLATADFDRDGKADIFVTNYEEELSALYRNAGEASFIYESRQSGLNRLGKLFVGFGCVAGDFDLDGDSDVAIANGHAVRFPVNSQLAQHPLLLLNQEGRFQRLNFPPDSYFSSPHRGRGLATGDINRDGQLDLVYTHIKEPAVLMFGETRSKSNRLSIRLVGRKSNRDAIGSRIILKTDNREIVGWSTSGMGYLSSSPANLFFVIPDGDQIEELQVDWPSGTISNYNIEELGLDNETQEFYEIILVED